jgi:hypothetical protein
MFVMGRSPLAKVGFGVMTTAMGVAALAEWRRARYDLKSLAVVDEAVHAKIADANEAFCARCGSTYPARIPVCPRCGAPQGSLL